jgi:hypothetical protein
MREAAETAAEHHGYGGLGGNSGAEKINGVGHGWDYSSGKYLERCGNGFGSPLLLVAARYGRLFV